MTPEFGYANALYQAYTPGRGYSTFETLAEAKKYIKQFDTGTVKVRVMGQYTYGKPHTVFTWKAKVSNPKHTKRDGDITLKLSGSPAKRAALKSQLRRAGYEVTSRTSNPDLSLMYVPSFIDSVTRGTRKAVARVTRKRKKNSGFVGYKEYSVYIWMKGKSSAKWGYLGTVTALNMKEALRRAKDEYGHDVKLKVTNT